MSTRAHGGIGSVGPRGGCRGGGGGASGGNGNASQRRARRRQRDPLSLTVFLDVPPELRHAIIGRQGSVVMSIQDSSGAVVKIPPAGRNGRVKVMGVEASLLAACSNIAKAIVERTTERPTSQQPAINPLSTLDCTVDAGPLGRLVGKLYLPQEAIPIDILPTLLCRTEAAITNTATTDSSNRIVYVAHAIDMPAQVEESSANASGKCSGIAQEDIEVTLDNYLFAADQGGGDLPISACFKGDCIFVSGIIMGANGNDCIDGVVQEMEKLVKSFQVGSSSEE